MPSYDGKKFALEYDRTTSSVITHNIPLRWKSDIEFLFFATEIHEQIRSLYTEISLLLDSSVDDLQYVQKEMLLQLKNRKQVYASYLGKVKELQKDFIELDLNSSKKIIQTVNDRMRKLEKYDRL